MRHLQFIRGALAKDDLVYALAMAVETERMVQANRKGPLPSRQENLHPTDKYLDFIPLWR